MDRTKPGRSSISRRAGLLVLAWAVATGCERAAPAEGGIGEDAFVGAFVELRRAAAEETTEAGFASRREEILRAHGVTEASLERFIDDHAGDLEYLSSVWDRIDRTLRGELDADGEPVVPGAPAVEGDGGDT